MKGDFDLFAKIKYYLNEKSVGTCGTSISVWEASRISGSASDAS
jgi:hypothetical protein